MTEVRARYLACHSSSSSSSSWRYGDCTQEARYSRLQRRVHQCASVLIAVCEIVPPRCHCCVWSYVIKTHSSRLLNVSNSNIGPLLTCDRLPPLALFIHELALRDHAKELVHAFERTTFGLRHEDPREDEHGEAKAAIDEVRAISAFSNSGDHVRRGTSYYEVEQPLRCRSDGDVQCS